LSTFINLANQNPSTKRISASFFPAITNRMKKVFKQHKIDLVTTSSGYKLKNQLHSTKDMKPTNEKSGVYEIKCETRNCHYKYIGWTRRFVTARFKEHKSHTSNNHIQLSFVANHMNMKLNGGRKLCEHNFDLQNLKVLKVVTNQKKLDAYASILLYKNPKKKLINNEQQIHGIIVSPLFKLLD
jgi:hypothetical protein